MKAADAHLCANFSAFAGASGTVGSFSARCLQKPSKHGVSGNRRRNRKGNGDRIKPRPGGVLEGRDRVEKEVNPLDLDRGGLARVVGGETVGDGAGAVGALDRRLQQRERH